MYNNGRGATIRPDCLPTVSENRKCGDVGLNQAEQIQQAVLRSIHSRDLYTERQVNSMLKVLHTSEMRVKAQLVEIGDKQLLKKGLEVRREQLRGIQKGIDEIISGLKSEQTLIMKTAVRESFQNGITGGIGEFSELKFPHYENLSHEDRIKLAGQVMSLTDRSALDFLVNYDLQLLGNVTRELADNIKQQISVGIVNGDSIAKIGEKIGGVTGPLFWGKIILSEFKDEMSLDDSS